MEVARGIWQRFIRSEKERFFRRALLWLAVAFASFIAIEGLFLLYLLVVLGLCEKTNWCLPVALIVFIAGLLVAVLGVISIISQRHRFPRPGNLCAQDSIRL